MSKQIHDSDITDESPAVKHAKEGNVLRLVIYTLIGFSVTYSLITFYSLAHLFLATLVAAYIEWNAVFYGIKCLAFIVAGLISYLLDELTILSTTILQRWKQSNKQIANKVGFLNTTLAFISVNFRMMLWLIVAIMVGYANWLTDMEGGKVSKVKILDNYFGTTVDVAEQKKQTTPAEFQYDKAVELKEKSARDRKEKVAALKKEREKELTKKVGESLAVLLVQGNTWAKTEATRIYGNGWKELWNEYDERIAQVAVEGRKSDSLMQATIEEKLVLLHDESKRQTESAQTITDVVGTGTTGWSKILFFLLVFFLVLALMSGHGLKWIHIPTLKAKEEKNKKNQPNSQNEDDYDVDSELPYQQPTAQRGTSRPKY